VIGVIHEGSVNRRWLAHVQTSAQDAQSTQRRFSRWLHNARIHPTHLYSPLIQAALAGWEEQVLYLSLDTTMLWDKFCVIRLSVVYRSSYSCYLAGAGSSSVKFIVYQDLLDKAARLLPEGAKSFSLATVGLWTINCSVIYGNS